MKFKFNIKILKKKKDSMNQIQTKIKITGRNTKKKMKIKNKETNLLKEVKSKKKISKIMKTVFSTLYVKNANLQISII